jgi:hypothetical protein
MRSLDDLVNLLLVFSARFTAISAVYVSVHDADVLHEILLVALAAVFWALGDVLIRDRRS